MSGGEVSGVLSFMQAGHTGAATGVTAQSTGPTLRTTSGTRCAGLAQQTCTYNDTNTPLLAPAPAPLHTRARLAHRRALRLHGPHGVRSGMTYPVRVDDVDDHSELAVVRTAVQEHDTADLDVALERLAVNTHDSEVDLVEETRRGACALGAGRLPLAPMKNARDMYSFIVLPTFPCCHVLVEASGQASTAHERRLKRFQSHGSCTSAQAGTYGAVDCPFVLNN